MKAFTILINALLLTVLVLGSSTVSQAGSPNADDLKKLQLLQFSPPDKAPDFTLRDLAGKEVAWPCTGESP